MEHLIFYITFVIYNLKYSHKAFSKLTKKFQISNNQFEHRLHQTPPKALHRIQPG